MKEKSAHNSVFQKAAEDILNEENKLPPVKVVNTSTSSNDKLSIIDLSVNPS